MVQGKADTEFNEIVCRDIKNKIAEAFNGLECNLRMGLLAGLTDKDIQFLEKKARLMKAEVDTFIDSQMERVKTEMKGGEQDGRFEE